MALSTHPRLGQCLNEHEDVACGQDVDGVSGVCRGEHSQCNDQATASVSSSICIVSVWIPAGYTA